MIRIAIVEDEDTYAQQLQEYIDQFRTEKHLNIEVTRFRDGDEITEHYQCDYNIILMDIQMKFMDGMSAAEEIRKVDHEVVIMFITNMTNYAIRGYQVDALDYVLKPVSYFAFTQKLERAISRVGNRRGSSISVTTSGGVQRIELNDLYYVESEGHNLRFHLSNSMVISRMKISDLEEQLLENNFVRCNKGYLVNLKFVDGVKDGCVLVGRDQLVISRGRKNEFMEALMNYMKEH